LVGPSLAEHVLSTKRNIANRFHREHSASSVTVPSRGSTSIGGNSAGIEKPSSRGVGRSPSIAFLLDPYARPPDAYEQLSTISSQPDLGAPPCSLVAFPLGDLARDLDVEASCIRILGRVVVNQV